MHGSHVSHGRVLPPGGLREKAGNRNGRETPGNGIFVPRNEEERMRGAVGRVGMVREGGRAKHQEYDRFTSMRRDSIDHLFYYVKKQVARK
jgi:hypothetical protein